MGHLTCLLSLLTCNAKLRANPDSAAAWPLGNTTMNVEIVTMMIQTRRSSLMAAQRETNWKTTRRTWKRSSTSQNLREETRNFINDVIPLWPCNQWQFAANPIHYWLVTVLLHWKTMLDTRPTQSHYTGARTSLAQSQYVSILPIPWDNTKFPDGKNLRYGRLNSKYSGYETDALSNLS